MGWEIWVLMSICAILQAGYRAIAPALFLVWPADDPDLGAALRNARMSRAEGRFDAMLEVAMSAVTIALAVAVIVAVVQGRLG
jgi:hypothetical protein